MKRTGSSRFTMVLLIIMISGAVGCAAPTSRSLSTSSAIRAAQGGTRVSPAQHARDQVQWLRSRSGQLSDQQLYLLQQIPWNSGSQVDLARQRMLERGRTGRQNEEQYGRHRVLGRPRVMDSARDALRVTPEGTENTDKDAKDAGTS
ncbi:MAG: hypothetical protein OSB09_10295 [Planctomycetota bacterium]|nr:hypothetical protein [Planctomycetota bacterium]